MVQTSMSCNANSNFKTLFRAYTSSLNYISNFRYPGEVAMSSSGTGIQHNMAIGLSTSLTEPTKAMEGVYNSLSKPIRRVEKINVLEVTRQLQPPQDIRCDITNLDDLGDLMTPSELSLELKRLNPEDSDNEEVNSTHAKSTEKATSQESKALVRSSTTETAETMHHPLTGFESGSGLFPNMEGSSNISIDGKNIHYRGTSRSKLKREAPSNADSMPSFSESPFAKRSATSLSKSNDILSPSILSKQFAAIQSVPQPPFYSSATYSDLMSEFGNLGAHLGQKRWSECSRMDTCTSGNRTDSLRVSSSVDKFTLESFASNGEPEDTTRIESYHKDAPVNEKSSDTSSQKRTWKDGWTMVGGV